MLFDTFFGEGGPAYVLFQEHGVVSDNSSHRIPFPIGVRSALEDIWTLRKFMVIGDRSRFLLFPEHERELLVIHANTLRIDISDGLITKDMTDEFIGTDWFDYLEGEIRLFS
jgi:hypothetical protein